MGRRTPSRLLTSYTFVAIKVKGLVIKTLFLSNYTSVLYIEFFYPFRPRLTSMRKNYEYCYAKRPASDNRASARSTGHASLAAGFGSNSFEKRPKCTTGSREWLIIMSSP